jgi:protein SCO1
MRSITKFLVFIFLAACSTVTEKEKSGLPYLGHHDVDPSTGDTTYHVVPEFAFENQDGIVVTNQAVKDKVHIVNFFFTSCPSICPKMMSQIKRLQKLATGEDIMILSYSVDPKRDSVARLKKYATDNEFKTANWHLMTGESEEVYELGMNGYNLSAMEDESADGGFLHSEMVVLVDRSGHIRGMYEGTRTESMDALLEAIKRLNKYNE